MKNALLLLLISLLFIGCKQKGNESIIDTTSFSDIKPVSDVIDNSAQTDEVLPYQVIVKKDISYIGKSRMVYRVLLNVESIPIESIIRNTAYKIWESSQKKYDLLTIFMYLPKMDYNDVAYVVAEFDNSSIVKFEIQDYALSGTIWSKEEAEQKIEDAKWKEEKKSTQVKEYYIKLDTPLKEDRSIDIKIHTNFPDGTKLLVDVTRSYYEKGSSEEYSGDIFSEVIAVKNGMITQRVIVDDSKWVSEYDNRKKQYSSIASFPGIGRISSQIEVEVLFTPLGDQSEETLNILGSMGENVKGAGAEKFGKGMKCYKVVKKISIPFKK